MWELIRANNRKSVMLFIILGIFLVVLGYLIGSAYLGPDGGISGVIMALFIWGIWSLIGYFGGDSIVLNMAGAKKVTPDVHPQLFNVVEEMKIAAGLPVMPKVYIIDSPAPNAFAVGRKPEKCAIAVTAGLLSRLNRDELQGVVAHETGHIHNRDVKFMTFAGIMLGTVILISHIFLRSLWFGGGSSRRYRSKSKDGGQAQAILMIVAIVFAILAPIMAQLLYLAISRQREYLADATAVRFTRYPEGLASALEKISRSTEDMPNVNKATAPIYFVNPLKPKGRQLSNLSSTHPPITERIAILRALSMGASLANYQAAYNKIKGKKSSLIPKSGLEDITPVPILTGKEKVGDVRSAKTQKRDLGDLMRAANKYVFLACVGCGLKIKIPPDFKKKSFPCPRCKTEVQVPVAEMAAAAVVLEGVERAQKEKAARNQQVYKRKSTNWESFRCTCGKTLQLSPHFTGQNLTCNNCGRQIKIES
jgi:heat shock protein HtpX